MALDRVNGRSDTFEIDELTVENLDLDMIHILPIQTLSHMCCKTKIDMLYLLSSNKRCLKTLSA